ncbi:MAG: hypothetical protein WKF91_20395, partial [Segetibacter sp.]
LTVKQTSGKKITQMTKEQLTELFNQGHLVSNDLDFDFWEDRLNKQITKSQDEKLIEAYENEKIQIVAALAAWALLEAEPNKVKSLNAQNSFVLTRELNWLKNSIDNVA